MALPKNKKHHLRDVSSFPLPGERFFHPEIPKSPPVESIEENNIQTSFRAKATGRWSEFLQNSLQQTQVEVCHGRRRRGVFLLVGGAFLEMRIFHDFPPSTARDVPHKLTPFLLVTWNCCGPYKTLRVNWKRPYKLKHCLTSCSLFHYSHSITCVYDSVFSMFFRSNTKGSPLHTCREGFAIEKGELELNDGFQKFHKCLWHSTGKLCYIEHYPWSAYVKT